MGIPVGTPWPLEPLARIRIAVIPAPTTTEGMPPVSKHCSSKSSPAETFVATVSAAWTMPVWVAPPSLKASAESEPFLMMQKPPISPDATFSSAVAVMK